MGLFDFLLHRPDFEEGLERPGLRLAEAAGP